MATVDIRQLQTDLPHEHERAGRWWWEAGAQKECGLHAGNVKDNGTSCP